MKMPAALSKPVRQNWLPSAQTALNVGHKVSLGTEEGYAQEFKLDRQGTSRHASRSQRPCTRNSEPCDVDLANSAGGGTSLGHDPAPSS